MKDLGFVFCCRCCVFVCVFSYLFLYFVFFFYAFVFAFALLFHFLSLSLSEGSRLPASLYALLLCRNFAYVSSPPFFLKKIILVKLYSIA